MGRIKSEAGHAGIKRGPKGKKEAAIKNGFDGPLSVPLRKTATIFNQSITLVHSTRSNTEEAPPEKIKKYASIATEKPLSVFWVRALDNISAMAPLHKFDKTNIDYLNLDDEYVPQKTGLPESVTPYCNVLSSESSALSLANALCKPDGPANGVVGQTPPTKSAQENPTHNANPDQPLVLGITKIQQEDILKQEQNVLDMRKRLQELRNSFIFRPSSE